MTEKVSKELNKRFPGGIAETNWVDTDYPEGNVHWLRFNGAQCPICHHTDWCCVNVTGTKVVCMRVNDGKAPEIGNGGHLYELKGSSSIKFDPASVKKSSAVPYTSNKVMDVLYRLVLLGCPLTEHHKANLRKRGLTDQQIQLHGSRGFGSYYSQAAAGRKYHAKPLQNAKLVMKKDGCGDIISRWENVLEHLGLRKDAWKGVPGFYLKEVKVNQSITYDVKDQGEITIKPGQYNMPVFEANADGMLIPYYDELNQLVGFQTRVDQIKAWAKILESPDDGEYSVTIDANKRYAVDFTDKNGFKKQKVATGILANDHDEVSISISGQPLRFKPKFGGKYFWVSSSLKKDGAEGKTPIQVSYNPEVAQLKPGDSRLLDYIKKPKSVWLTEGGLKAIVATDNLAKNFTNKELDYYGHDFLAVAGVSSYHKFMPMLKKLNVNHVTVAFDRDFISNDQVANNLVNLVNLLRKQGIKVTVAFWKDGKGIDDALVNGSEIRFKEI